MLFKDFQKISFNGVTGAFFGAGDQFGYSCNYLDAVGILAREFMEKGGSLVGRWSTDEYEFDESIALENDEFLGLALDYDNQPSLSEDRIKKWVAMIHSEFK
jgi:flavodoxin I